MFRATYCGSNPVIKAKTAQYGFGIVLVPSRFEVQLWFPDDSTYEVRQQDVQKDHHEFSDRHNLRLPVAPEYQEPFALPPRRLAEWAVQHDFEWNSAHYKEAGFEAWQVSAYEYWREKFLQIVDKEDRDPSPREMSRIWEEARTIAMSMYAAYERLVEEREQERSAKENEPSR